MTVDQIIAWTLACVFFGVGCGALLMVALDERRFRKVQTFRHKDAQDYIAAQAIVDAFRAEESRILRGGSRTGKSESNA